MAKKKPSVGRPPETARVYEPELVERIIQAKRLGAKLKECAHYGGVHPNTLQNWLNRGAAEAQRLAANPKARGIQTEKVYLDFHKAWYRSEGQAVAGWLAVIERAGVEGDWRAAAHLLEIFSSREYSTKAIVAIEGHDGGAVQHGISADVRHTHRVDVKQLNAELEERLKRMATTKDAKEDSVL